MNNDLFWATAYPIIAIVLMIMGFRRDPLYFYGAIIIGFVAWYWIVKALKEQRKEKSYGLLKFKYNNYYKIVKITQKRAIRDHNRYIRNFVRKHKRNPDRRESSSSYDLNGHETISYRKGKSGHWKRQWVRQYLYGLHKIKYTKK